MPLTVTVSNQLGEWWATDEQLAEMSDEEIVELIGEDTLAFLDGAVWAVERPRKANIKRAASEAAKINNLRKEQAT